MIDIASNGNVVAFRSRFDIDAEAAVAAAVFGLGDGGRARIKARRQADEDTAPSDYVAPPDDCA